MAHIAGFAQLRRLHVAPALPYSATAHAACDVMGGFILIIPGAIN